MQQAIPASWRQSKRTKDDSGGESVPLPLSASSSVTVMVGEGGDNVAHVEEGGDDVASAAAGSVAGEIRCAAASSVADTAEAAPSSHDQLTNLLQQVVTGQARAEMKAELLQQVVMELAEMRAMAAAASENQPLRDAEQALQDTERRKQEAAAASEEQALRAAERSKQVAAIVAAIVERGWDDDVPWIKEIQAAAAGATPQSTRKSKSKKIEDHVWHNCLNSKRDRIVKMKPSKIVLDKNGLAKRKHDDGFEGLRLIGQTSSKPPTTALKRRLAKEKQMEPDATAKRLQKLNTPTAGRDVLMFVFSFEVEEGAETVAMDDFFSSDKFGVSLETVRDGLARRGEVPGKSAAKPLLLLIQTSKGCYPLDFEKPERGWKSDRALDDTWQKLMHNPYPEHRQWNCNGTKTRCDNGMVFLHQVAAAALPPDGTPVNFDINQDGTWLPGTHHVVRRVSLEELKRMLVRRVGTLPLADGIADGARASAWTAFMQMHGRWLGKYDPSSSPSDPIWERGY